MRADAKDVVLVALKRKVAAIARGSGEFVWVQELPKGSGGAFITLACDDTRVFACTNGHLHCLDLQTGRLLWINRLPDFGYALASLCVPGHGAAPDPAAIAQLEEDARSSSSSSSPPPPPP